jgi:prepilin-type processing-associated H-X9-DG protein
LWNSSLCTTFLVGEKSLSTKYYYTHGDLDQWTGCGYFCGGEAGSALVGNCYDIARYYTIGSVQSAPSRQGDLLFGPFPDPDGDDNWLTFGGPHATAYNVGFCDGSVQAINYVIDHAIYNRMVNRHDGLPIAY